MLTKLSHVRLTPSLFWDVDAATFDLQKGRRLVLQRVLSLGTLEDLRLLKKLYSTSAIRKGVLEIRNWDPQVLNFISVWLDIPKDKFACCTSRHLRPKHWD